MDVQGSRFHLLDGRPDWDRCVDATARLPLGEVWAGAQSPSTAISDWEYDASARALRLRRETPLFRHAGRDEPLVLDDRRGAGRDGDGNWFWIDESRTAIRQLPVGSRVARDWWTSTDLSADCRCAATPDAGTFAGVCTCAATVLTLSGLTVTRHQYLLAGYWSSAEAGILVFDLRAGGTPLRMLWPSTFRPWDMADCDDGGALVLDREHAEYWRLDEHLRLRGSRPQRISTFGSGDPGHVEPPPLSSGPVEPSPIPLRAVDGAPIDAVSIEPGPAGGVLVLGTGSDASVVYCFDGAQLRWQTSLSDSIEVSDPRTSTSSWYSVLGHDMAYLTTGGPLDGPLLYIADSRGDQVIAFDVDTGTGHLSGRDDFLPLRRWGARAVVRAADELFYDFGERWITVQAFTECRFTATATLTTAAEFADPPGLSGDSFDSGIPGCQWHRLMLDAHVPTGAAVSVRARASDDATLLEDAPWIDQPAPYLRGDGSELPWTDPWADRRGDPRDPRPLPAGMGTHELLFQQVFGRYLQLELTATGGGRATPLIRSVRAWFPRFSYVRHYLPAVYAEQDEPARFLERFLANQEGMFTALEEKIEHTHLLLDGRTAPAADLPWLACWFGLALDPQWDETRRRFLIRHVDRFYRLRGTVIGVVAILRAYLEPQLDERVFCSPLSGAGGVRLIERFLTRDTGGAAYGDSGAVTAPDPWTRATLAAHRFDVLVPASLAPDSRAMVERIVAAARPAHTAFVLRTFDELFVIGQARLGLDTELCTAPIFSTEYTGMTRLGTGFLGYHRPFDLSDRVVSDRDRVGHLPPL